MTTYEGFDVFEDEPCREIRDDDFGRSMVRLDGGTGRIKYEIRDSEPMIVRPLRWVATSRAEIAALRAFLDARKGRAVPFWMPTWDADLVLAADITPAATNIIIKSCGYTQHLFPHPARRRLAIMVSPGVYAYRKVLAAVNNGDGTETLTIDSILGVSPARDQTILSYLTLRRLHDDENEIMWRTAGVAECTLRTVEIPTEVPA